MLLMPSSLNELKAMSLPAVYRFLNCDGNFGGADRQVPFCCINREQIVYHKSSHRTDELPLANVRFLTDVCHLARNDLVVSDLHSFFFL